MLGKLKALSIKAFYKEVSAKENLHIQNLFKKVEKMMQEKFRF